MYENVGVVVVSVDDWIEKGQRDAITLISGTAIRKEITR
jgi:hypothetical protein